MKMPVGFGIITQTEGFYDHELRWRRSVFGYLCLVTDKEWDQEFRSGEKWCAVVAASADGEPRMIIPGCRVEAVVFVDQLNVKNVDVLDVRDIREGACPNP